MADNMSDFTKSLKQIRRDKGLTQQQLAEILGIPQAHISNIEAGKVDLKVSSLINMARALGLEPMLIPKRVTPAIRMFLSKKTKK